MKRHVLFWIEVRSTFLPFSDLTTSQNGEDWDQRVSSFYFLALVFRKALSFYVAAF